MAGFDAWAEAERQSQGAAPEPAQIAADLAAWGLDADAWVVDIGCGTGQRTLALARALARGQAVGVDLHAPLLRVAAAQARARGVANVAWVQADAARTGLLSGAFDLALVVATLWAVPEPLAVLGELARLVRPGGLVVAREGDGGAEALREPPWPPAAQRLDRALAAYVSAQGGDLAIGRRLYALFRAAGLTDVRVDVRPVTATGPTAATLAQLADEQIAQWAPDLVAGGYLTDAELAGGRVARARAASDPDGFSLHLTFTVTGRKG